jgi:hypothetical protein
MMSGRVLTKLQKNKYKRIIFKKQRYFKVNTISIFELYGYKYYFILRTVHFTG